MIVLHESLGDAKFTKLLSAIGSVIDSKDEDEIKQVVAQLQDPLGTFYRFGLPGSLFRRRLMK